ncbi:MAG TPA: copper chaperone PCu(A)C [Anaerolineales bacterium]|nr:copper chaperone PCu(A)C [Anaerolineales bacterium]
MNKLFLAGSFFLTIFVLTACGSATPEPSHSHEGGEHGVSVTDAWGRPSPMMAGNGAFYMMLENSGAEDDTLVSGSSPACGTVELHETYDKGGGVMGMRPVEGGIMISAGGSAELKPGGLHVMCIGTTDAFTVGKSVELKLVFEHGGEQTLQVEVREE